MSQRHESASRPRFLLTLSVSTVMALAVAVPLTIQARNVDDNTPLGYSEVAQIDPDSIQSTDQGDLLGASGHDDRLAIENRSQGGIGAKEPAKVQGQTSKSEIPSTTTTSSTLPPASSSSTSSSTSSTVDQATTSTTAGDSSSTSSSSTSTTVDDGSSTTSTSDDTSSTTSSPSSTVPADTIDDPIADTIVETVPATTQG